MWLEEGVRGGTYRSLMLALAATRPATARMETLVKSMLKVVMFG